MGKVHARGLSHEHKEQNDEDDDEATDGADLRVQKVWGRSARNVKARAVVNSPSCPFAWSLLARC